MIKLNSKLSTAKASLIEAKGNICDWSDQDIQKIKTKLQSKGSFEYSFSHFDLETEIFYGNVKKAKLSKSNWIKKSSYSSSRMPTVMKKIVDIAV